MLKKIIGGLILTLSIGILLFGAVNRTLAKTSNSELLNTGTFTARNNTALNQTDDLDNQGQRNGGGGRNQSEREEPINLALNLNNQENLTDKRSGSGRLSESNINDPVYDLTGTETSQNSQGNGYQRGNLTTASLNNSPVFEENEEWVELEGTLQTANADEYLILCQNGEEVLLEGRSLETMLSAGFFAEVNDPVQLKGFYEGEDFETAQISNLKSGQIVSIRSENGRPLWAGNGRRGGN